MRIIVLLALFIQVRATAQIVNIENKRIEGSTQGFFGSADLNLNFTMNTKQLLQIGDKLKVGFTKDKHHAFLITDHSFVKSQDDSFINKGYEHLRYNYELNDSGHVVFEAFQQGQFNKIQRIDLRLLLGSGIRFNIIRQKNYELSFGTGFMGEYEQLTDNAGYTADFLSTSYLSFDGQFSENIGFNTISYLQPKLTDVGFYRFANESYLRFRVNKYLSFKIVYTVTHDNRDIEGVRKTNYILKNTLSFQF